MRVLIKGKTTFNQSEYSGVTNIAYTSGNYVLTLSGGSTVTFSAASYNIYILV